MLFGAFQPKEDLLRCEVQNYRAKTKLELGLKTKERIGAFSNLQMRLTFF